jgi:4-amino-4-deoxychorismate lyase
VFLVDGVATEDDIWSDRGLAYGDGVFETLAWDAGRLLAWSSHVERLRRGCEMLGIPPPQDRRLREECLAVARSMPKAVVKVIVTRGVGGRGYRPPLAAVPRRIVAAHPWPNDIGSTQTRTWICAQPVSINPSTAGIKHLNRLDQVLASREWPGDDYFEGLMLDPSGLLIEGTRSNVFVVHEGVVATPDLAQCGVKGIVRNAVIACCHRTGVDVFEAPLSVNGLTAADEVFICNSIIGVRPVTAVECPQEIRFQPGPITGRIADALRSDGVIV